MNTEQSSITIYRVVSSLSMATILVLSVYALGNLSNPHFAEAASCNNLSIESAYASGNNGNPSSKAIDNNLSTRWSADGIGSWITADLGARNTICSVSIAWYMGNERQYDFSIATSTDNTNYLTQYAGESSGTTLNYESYNFYDTNARYVKITVNGNSANTYASINELDVFGFYSSDLTPPTIPISKPTAGSSVPPGNVSVQGTASDNSGGSGIQVVLVKVEGGDYKQATPKAIGDWSTWTSTIPINSQGTYTITAKAYDKAGNQQWKSISMKVSSTSSGNTLYDDFGGGTYSLTDGQTSPNGKWYVRYNSQGSSGVKQDSDGRYVFYEYPKTSTSSSQTFSNMVRTTSMYKDVQISIDVKTVKQLRQNSKPNTWEVAWVFWRYTDSKHNYYFMLKTNGFELGKQDGSELETFLMTGFSPKVVIGQWSHWDIKIVGSHITIKVNGVVVVDMYDKTMSSQLGGQGYVTLYNEDANVNFDNVNITPQ